MVAFAGVQEGCGIAYAWFTRGPRLDAALDGIPSTVSAKSHHLPVLSRTEGHADDLVSTYGILCTLLV